MSRRGRTVARIRDLIAAGAAAATIIAGTFLVGPETSNASQIRIGAFNVQVFGQAKRSDPEIMEVLVEVARSFDILAVQEVRDASEVTADVFLDAINEDADLTYAMYEGERLGSSSSKEQYVIYYVPALVQLQHAYTFPDTAGRFERDPLVATFRAGNFDFTLVVCHVRPEEAEREILALRSAVSAILTANPDEEDVILMGDFNADGTYFDEDDLSAVFPLAEFHIVIGNEIDTMTTSNNTYDRLILRDATFGHEYVGGSANRFEFDAVLGLGNLAFVRRVSDHYPVSADFQLDLADDDGPS